jgi:hypothetical protein
MRHERSARGLGYRNHVEIPAWRGETAVSGHKVVEQLHSSLVRSGAPAVFSDDELEGLDEPVCRYFRAAIAPGVPLAVSARFRMRGRIKLGRWLSFRARQTLTPHVGFVWAARVAGVISGYDYYAEGRGGMHWRLAGLVTVAHADGPDATRASAERGAGEAIWVPTALLPRFEVSWSTETDRDITARYQVDGRPFALRLRIDDAGLVESFSFDRWHEPEGDGRWTVQPFGGVVTGHRTFEGITIPNRGHAGWFFGTDRWVDGEFIHYEITTLDAL